MVPNRKIMVCILTAVMLIIMAIPSFASSRIEVNDQQKAEAVEQTGQSERSGQTEQTEQMEEAEEPLQPDQAEIPAGTEPVDKQPAEADEQTEQTEQAGEPEQTEKPVEESEEKEDGKIPDDETQEENNEEAAVSTPKSAAAAPVKAVSGLPENNAKVSYTSAGSHPVKFTVTTGGYIFRGTCATLGVDNAKSGTATVKRISKSSRIAKLVYYYGYKKGWWYGENSTKKATTVIGFTDKNCTENAKQCIEALIQRDRMGWDAFWKARKVGKYRMYSTDSFMRAINNLYNNTDVSKITIPDDVIFEMFHGVTSSSKVQDFYVWRYREIPVVPNGYVAVDKVSRNVSITN